MTTLESRYRRLLSWYPAEHRKHYGEEMLGVLMEGAGPQQQRPGLGETFDLMRNALWKRVGQTGESIVDGSPWAKAGAVVGLLASLMAFTAYAGITAAGLVMSDKLGWPFPTSSAIFAAGWLAITLIVLSRWRTIAVGLAWLAAFAEIGWSYLVTAVPVDMIYRYEYMVVGLTAAIGLTLTRKAPSGASLIGARGVKAAFGISVVSIIWAFVDEFPTLQGWAAVWIARSILLAAIVVFLVLFRRLDKPVRRRVLTIVMPAIAVHLCFSYNSGDFLAVTSDEMLAIPFVVLALSLLVLWIAERFQLVRKAPPSTGTDSPVK